MPPTLHHQILGDPQAPRSLLFMHGFPGSWLQAKFLEEHLSDHDARVISIDRPGYGHSPPINRNRLPTFFNQLQDLLEHLQVKDFGSIGVSGGAPYALMIAHQFRGRVRSLTQICGLVPLSREFLPAFHPTQTRLLRTLPQLPLFVLQPLADAALKSFDPEKKIAWLLSRLSPEDREVLSEARTQSVFLESMREARRQAASGIIFDGKTYAHDFVRARGITPEAMANIPIQLWHGERDHILSSQMSVLFHRKFQHSQLHVLPEEGHYSLPVRRASEILASSFASW